MIFLPLLHVTLINSNSVTINNSLHLYLKILYQEEVVVVLVGYQLTYLISITTIFLNILIFTEEVIHMLCPRGFQRRLDTSPEQWNTTQGIICSNIVIIRVIALSVITLCNFSYLLTIHKAFSISSSSSSSTRKILNNELQQTLNIIHCSKLVITILPNYWIMMILINRM